ncbi:MAG: hypothetical protein KJ556_04835 [Gammaproteobacteria bacterium]|nr:hypothetical protein [Gammaproteobacteria bacterium]MBU2059586.1 hypothetical protein [Gammaproteobacteria bacterium]MBU2174433.1 hypothetical protein [Gammaproteobacteria bacterium]MBU2248058.1 hypothetical protein [Gammaproteobacteria bacterium]MBU2345528.1 hypothetical protein [Gammaproteobacteria bacterium]
MKKLILSALLCCGFANASITDCQELYVGRIWVEKGVGLQGVVFLNNKEDGGGSYWSYFVGWSADERKEALSLLIAAKASGHRVNIATEDSDGCGIEKGGTHIKSVYLANNP